MPETTACLSLGSNLGDSASILQNAVTHLDNIDGILIDKTSSLFRTSPVDAPDHPPFLNAAARLLTSLAPRELLAACLATEAHFGRTRSASHPLPRTLDIDIIFYGSLRLSSPPLTLPHPRYTHRLFVLLPLLEIDPDLLDPDGTPLREILHRGNFSNRFAGQLVEKLLPLR